MVRQSFIASAPATFMVAGEHAVLHGEGALVGAIAKRLTVSITPRQDDKIVINSDRLGQYNTAKSAIVIQQPFHFVLGVLQRYQDLMPSGCEVQIHSEFSHQIGFGSSAAITVATLHALKQWLGQTLTQDSILREGRALIQQIQGLGSGADIAASVYGGIVYYEKDPLLVRVLPPLPAINLIYIGYKTPTAEVVNLVERNRQADPLRYQQLFKAIGECSQQCCEAIATKNYDELAQLFATHQKLQFQLGVSTEEIDEIIESANRLETIMGCKISGSGLGDCILAIGRLPKGYFPRNRLQQANGVQQFAMKVTATGLQQQAEMPQKWVVHG